MKPEYTNSQIKQLIEEHIHSERDRIILKLRFVDGLTYAAISDKLEEQGFILSSRHISTIVSTNAAKLNKYL